MDIKKADPRRSALPDNRIHLHKRGRHREAAPSEQRHDNIDPEPADRHHEHHRRNHIRGREHLHLDHAEAGRQQQDTAAGLEVVDHRRGRQRIDHAGERVQQHKDHELRKRDEGHNRTEEAGENHRRKDIEDGLRDEDRLLAGHAGHDRTIDAGAARTEQDDDRDQRRTELLLADRGLLFRQEFRNHALHRSAALRDKITEMNREADGRADHYRKDDRRHIFHEHDAADAHRHGTDAEDHVEILLEVEAQLMTGQRADEPSDGDR